MVVTTLLLLFGVPAIVALTVRAIRRGQALTRRIAEVREEIARSPLPPYAALAALMQEQEAAAKPPPRVWPPAPQRPRRGEDRNTHG